MVHRGTTTWLALPLLALGGAGCATVSPTEAAPAPGARATFTDMSRAVSFFYYIDPGCVARGRPQVRIVKPAEHGTLRIVEGEGFPNFPANNVRFECNKQRLPGTYVNYRSNPGYTGPDTAQVEILYPTGAVGQANYRVQVFAFPRKVADPQPVYPEAARVNNLEGDVVAWITIDADGNVPRVEIRQTPGEAFSEEVKAKLGRWKYRTEPASKAAFPVVAEFRIVFRLVDAVPGVDQR